MSYSAIVLSRMSSNLLSTCVHEWRSPRGHGQEGTVTRTVDSSSSGVERRREIRVATSGSCSKGREEGGKSASCMQRGVCRYKREEGQAPTNANRQRRERERRRDELTVVVPSSSHPTSLLPSSPTLLQERKLLTGGTVLLGFFLMIFISQKDPSKGEGKGRGGRKGRKEEVKRGRGRSRSRREVEGFSPWRREGSWWS